MQRAPKAKADLAGLCPPIPAFLRPFVYMQIQMGQVADTAAREHLACACACRKTSRAGVPSLPMHLSKNRLQRPENRRYQLLIQ
jgi:hypothetical protein